MKQSTEPLNGAEAARVRAEVAKLVETGAVSLCACLGPQAGDPYCPCVMRQKGLKSNVPEPTAEERAKAEAALREVFSRYPGKN